MLSNFHTHTCFCDGKNSPEEMIQSAIKKGFGSLGFSGHGYTPFDLSYCIKNTDEYISKIKELKEKYCGIIEVYLGAEEDAFSPVDRSRFDYIIGSSHYLLLDGKYMPIDCGYEGFKKCLDAFDYNVIEMSEAYYTTFCDYIKKRKPDIIGHFDLLTKYDEIDESLFLRNPKYNALAEKYILKAAESGCIFEVNTGAISRGYRSTVYPNENLLHVLKKENARIILSSDSHNVDTIDSFFEEAKHQLYDIGFRSIYTILGGKFISVPIL